MENSQGVQNYSRDVLPQKSGEEIYVKDIGLAVIGDDYKVEKILDIYKITKK